MALKTHKLECFLQSLKILFAFPTTTELRACYELCRLGNNIGFWVVWLPTAWSIAMAYKAQPELSVTIALLRAALYVPLSFGVKSLIMTIDDLLDYDIDAVVERTKERAIPRGAISLNRAWLFFALQVVVGVYLAFRILNPTSLYTAMTVWPLYIIYPTCKRWTNIAPIPLGLMFSVGIFMGWSDVSVDGAVPWNILAPVYLAACFWTWSYETVYQHQDKADDVKIGVNSAALLCGQHTIRICTATAVGFMGAFAYGGILNGQGILFYVGVAAAGFVLIRGLLRTDVDCPAECKEFFLTTPLVGQLVLVGCVADAAVHRYLDART
ncbi:UbiA prenyltransferase [Mycena alexandri]|uniref:UbiA prenyltransferase n=1 Tax=Mycena alexandri TaxID=1745969 RepID=A0AAD6SSC2_9AGAR|nr:UbiA prenyltransferase [Mycena alexandri]